jgi:3-isopropylmalate/(R)-2-methylmalate dehydratase small subunit
LTVSGKAVVYGDDISTDLIYPGRYTYHLLSEEQMAEHALEDLDPAFRERDMSEVILVAGKNFGCGSAREQAVKCLKKKGIAAIVAKSISRIYYRNCINEGLLPIVCPEAVDFIRNEDRISIDVEDGVLTTAAGNYSFAQFPPFVQDILRHGGLISSVRIEFSQNQKKEQETIIIVNEN